MPLAKSLLPEFDHEMANTRKLLAVVPDAEGAWQPHEKSYTLGALAMHLANLPAWGVMTLEGSGYDMAAQEFSEDRSFTTAQRAVETHDTNVQAARAALAEASDEALMAPWTLRHGDHEIFTLPKIAVLRSFVMNHMIHHRGQLTVYLRLRGVPLPEIYGPTADSQT